ncbi:hypothetical protein [Cupriavidus pinatubonensis]|uniref:RecF/RecN/SMC N-terminal domain-containing protein n=1 Tax=Cupriavidus pinatubonensis TaxID=248026 RepID=A0ABN7ZFA8_9BURK|nr:hypothetical protein [Cupriavidus pinatubonensis]CAG9183893.1 hypothetical protein LMG23994_05257 [Cupriavidus pinatubonensis]
MLRSAQQQGAQHSALVQHLAGDGQSIEGLSGLTLDTLGLAIRIALTKFLPPLRVIMLDELGHGMDDERGAAMLGMLAAADFDQTILISHKEAVDAFAAHLVAVSPAKPRLIWPKVGGSFLFSPTTIKIFKGGSHGKREQFQGGGCIG